MSNYQNNTRPYEAILAGRTTLTDRDVDNAAIINLKAGGQMGFQPEYGTYLSNAAYVKRNLVPVLIQAPRGFNVMDNNTGLLTQTLKALVELHAKSIEGMNSTLRVEWTETPFGGAGEMQQDPSNVTRERSVPNFTWTEKYGKPINRFLELWITGLIMNPATKYPDIITMNNGVYPKDLLPDFTGATMLFFEPDPTHTRVTEAWLCTNMMPNSAGDNTGRRDLTAAGENVDYSIEFSAITQVGPGVRKFAQSILDGMNVNLGNANPNKQVAFMSGISADVRSAEKPGYTDNIKTAAEATLRP